MDVDRHRSSPLSLRSYVTRRCTVLSCPVMEPVFAKRAQGDHGALRIIVLRHFFAETVDDPLPKLSSLRLAHMDLRTDVTKVLVVHRKDDALPVCEGLEDAVCPKLGGDSCGRVLDRQAD